MTGENKRPLAGKRIVVTDAAGPLSAQLRELGAEVIDVPLTRVNPPTDLRAFGELVQDSHGYDWIIFASPEAADAFFDLFYKLYDDAREIGGARIAVVGSQTAQRLKAFHLRVDLQAEEPAAESLPREFKKLGGVENLRILFVKGEEARDVLPKELSAMGGIVDEGFAYRIVPETGDEHGTRRLFEEGADLITFTNSSAVENFLALGVSLPNETKVASISPAVSKTAREQGLKVELEARHPDLPSLAEAIEKFYRVKS